MMSQETLLISAIAAMASGMVGLWRHSVSQQKDSARLIFALLQRLALERGERPPSTKSTPAHVDHVEARQLAMKELNGEIEKLVKQYLNSEPPKVT